MIKIILVFTLFVVACSPKKSDETELVSKTLDQFNKDAADANFEAYFSHFAADGVFMGTDATERWDKKEFEIWAKPFFDRKTTWNFKALKRNIYFSDDGQFAWFDELLDTQMKVCRGSGVLIKEHEEWKLKQYVLSMTVPNEKVDEVVRLKKELEELIIDRIKP